MTFSDLEYEVVALRAIIDSLDSMLNHQLFSVRGESPDCDIAFDSELGKRLFSVLLVDFLEKMDKKLVGLDASALDVLVSVCSDPKLSDQRSISNLRDAINQLSVWLKQEIIVETWLPSIEQQIDLKLARIDFIRICGNISKHNIGRLTGVANRIAKILRDSGSKGDLEDALMIINEFYERFHDDVFGYHVSTIAEMLNEVRWGIHTYLTHEYQRSYIKNSDTEGKYSFDVPDQLLSPFSRTCYWELMNVVRKGPYVPQFVVWKHLKLRY